MNLRTLLGVGVLLVAVGLGACTSSKPGPRPLAEHPGNVFLAGEPVVVPLPGGAAGWVVRDYEGKAVAEGTAHQGQAQVGPLPVGYYELQRPGEAARVSIGVLAPLRVDTPATSPIALDVAMSWFYDEAPKPAVANLCRLAGVNWVRDRLAWGEIEPQRGQFKTGTRYDHSAAVQSAAGLRVLQVNHMSPGWANPDGKRFPLDLRDAYRFYREVAGRWRGQVLAIEPWNEADIDVFGGHTGAEMAALQKAAYLGLKAGNPDGIASLNVFAMSRRAQLEDLAENQAWRYFDTCNLHHYIPVEQYPSWYEAFRKVSGGRPLWVTEFAMPVQWSGDEKLQELDEATLREQARRLPKAFAASLHEGTAAAFYFLLPHYAEGKTQFGIVRKDLTPRPAYVALAAAGRLLADARPLGRWLAERAEVRAYVFAAKPDGVAREVLVAWSTGADVGLELPAAPVGRYDLLGRPAGATAGGPARADTQEAMARADPRPEAAKTVTLTRDPQYVVLPVGTAPKLGVTPAPPPPPRAEGKPSPVVLQALWPKERIALARSAYRISSEKPERVPVYVYNFSAVPVRGTLAVRGPAGWKLELPGPVEIGPAERKELALMVDCTGHATTATAPVTVTGDFGAAGQAVLSLRLQPEPVRLPAGAGRTIDGAREPARWQKEVSAATAYQVDPAAAGGATVSATLLPGDRWVYPRLDLEPEERPGDARELHFTLTAHAGAMHYRVILVEESGASYVAELVNQPTPGQTIQASVILEEAIFGAGWSPADPNGKLDVHQIKAIKLGGNTGADQVRYTVRDLRWVK